MTEKQFLYDQLGEKITYLEENLFSKDEKEVKRVDFPAILSAISFLKNHKYKLTSQGLNQIESIIFDATKKMCKIEQKHL